MNENLPTPGLHHRAWGGQAPAGRGPLCSLPTRSGMDARMGKQPAAGQAGVCFVGLRSHVLKLP